MNPAVFCAVAAVLVGAALQISSGMYDPRALALVTVATVLAVTAAVKLKSGTVFGDSHATLSRNTVPKFVLGLGSAGGLVVHFFYNPTFYGDPRKLESFHWFAAVGLVLLSAYLCLHLRASLIKARFLLLLAVFAMMGIAVLRSSPRPWVDVWVVQQGGSAALLAGHDPYSVTYPNIYGPMTEKMYGPEVLVNGRLAMFAYPPLTVVTDAPIFALFHDVRVAGLLAMLLAAWALAKALPGVTGELAALFILFQPRTFFVLEQAWTEPLVLATFCLALQWPAALGFLLASKQYSPLLALPLFLKAPRWRTLAIALAVLVAVTLPFVIWDAGGLYRGVVRMQFLQPFREDALSLLVPYARQFGKPAWAAIPGFVAAGLVLAVTLKRNMSTAQAAASAAAAWLAFVLLNKQAFCNYDWLGSGLLCAAAAAAAKDEA